MPAVPLSIIAPFWAQVAVLLPAHAAVHPLGCHRTRIADRIVVAKLVQVLVFGCADHRIAGASVSATTLRRRRDEWIAAGVMDALLTLVLGALRRQVSGVTRAQRRRRRGLVAGWLMRLHLTVPVETAHPRDVSSACAAHVGARSSPGNRCCELE